MPPPVAEKEHREGATPTPMPRWQEAKQGREQVDRATRKVARATRKVARAMGKVARVTGKVAGVTGKVAGAMGKVAGATAKGFDVERLVETYRTVYALGFYDGAVHVLSQGGVEV